MQGDEVQGLLDPELIDILERLSLVTGDMIQDRSGTAGPPRVDNLGIDFHEYAAFQPGLDIRHVDWSVYGRTGSLVVRAYETRRDLPICLLLDCSASMGLGSPSKLSWARRLAASIAYVGLVGYHPVRVIAFARDRIDILPHRMGREAIYEVLRFLTGCKAQGETSLAAGIAAGLEQVSRRAGRLFLISDFLDPKGLGRAFGLLGTTRRHTDLIAVLDPKEAELPEGAVDALDPETGRIEPMVVTPELAEGYQRNISAHRRELARRVHAIQATLCSFDCQTTIEDAIVQVLD